MKKQMRRLLMLFFCCILMAPVMAQQKNITYKLYGFVRDDLFYNSRKNVDAVDGLFHLFPLNEDIDAHGSDLNAVPSTNLSSITTRFGVDFSGPDVGAAKLTARVEADFTGSSATPYLLYLRQAYINLSWKGGSSLLAGHAWHPLFGEVVPDVLDLSTGCPFQPFNRSPQIRYRYTKNKVSLTASAIYQTTSFSPGPAGKSSEYLKNGGIPELFAGINYKDKDFLGGVGVEMLSLKPRTATSLKVNERLTTTSFVAQAQYKSGDLFIAGKTFLASNLGHTSLLGGYIASSFDSATEELKYTAQRHSTSWLNITYGDKWRGGLFLGYSKNLGTGKALLAKNTPFYGNGFNIDQLSNEMLTFSYNLPHWKAGVEYSATTAWYGDTALSNGKVSNTHPITGHRVLAVLMYFF
jgi:hypothetical protein